MQLPWKEILYANNIQHFFLFANVKHFEENVKNAQHFTKKVGNVVLSERQQKTRRKSNRQTKEMKEIQIR